DRLLPRDQRTARPARPARRARARREGGRAEALHQLRRAPDPRPGLCRARGRAGAARLADEGGRRQHAHVEADREAAQAPAVSFRDDGYAAVDWAARYLERVADLPVLAQVAPGELSAKLPESAPERGEPFANVLHDVDELLAATMNQVAILWRASPASTELELRVVDWVRQLLGLPDGWHGHIEDTASTSTLAALIAARHVTGRNAVVCSEHAHSSVEKDARMLGMELRKVPVDEELRMRLDGWSADDVACVVATVGTTSFASVDPVRPLAERAHAVGAWVHVDAAYAGSSWLVEEERWSADGVEVADSLVINPHKWLLVPMDCSLLWT